MANFCEVATIKSGEKERQVVMIVKFSGVPMKNFITLLGFISGPENLLRKNDVGKEDEVCNSLVFQSGDGDDQFGGFGQSAIVRLVESKTDSSNREFSFTLKFEETFSVGSTQSEKIAIPPKFFLKVYEIVHS